MIAIDSISRTDQTPYVSSGGYSMPSVGSTFDAPRIAVPRATDPTPSFPTVANILNGGPSVVTDYFRPPQQANDVNPSIPITQIGGHTITPSVPGASGTPSGTPASGGDTSVPSVGQDYFHDVLDLITSQLTTGQPSATQQFSATPIALPSGSYSGSGDDTSAAPASAARRPWLGLVIILAVAGGAYYWFVWRKKHSGGGAA